MATIEKFRIGVDFDNTIVSYDELFWRAAVDKGLIPESVTVTKNAVRDYLRSQNREHEWTVLQGVVYGERMVEADAFPGVIEFFTACMRSGIAPFVVSHRTKYPIVGKRHDLHAAATRWLTAHGMADLLPVDHVFFEISKNDKMARISALACTHFIDDLPEFLTMPGFPKIDQRILFNPQESISHLDGVVIMRSWTDILRYFRL